MASWTSTPYRDSSPVSPSSPLSPSSLPRWLRTSRSRPWGPAGSKIKVILLAAACLALGWMFTSMLGPTEDVDELAKVSYDSLSVGVLDDPSGFGRHTTSEQRPGILDDDEDDEDDSKDTSVSGALADLHHAVSHKIQSWNPYFAKGIAKPKSGYTKNLTASKIVGGMNSTALMEGETIKEGDTDAERLGAKVRVGKCTVLFSGNDFWERCVRTHERHDKFNGYRLHILRQQLIDDVWSKPAYVLSLLLREMSKPKSERLDWLFWVDADTVILNPMVPIETFLPPQGTEFDDVYLMYSNDWNGLNNGVFPIRVNEWAVQLFSGIVAYRHFKPDDPLVFRDQSAMNELMNEPQNKKHIVQAPQRWFNAYQGEHNETLQAFQVRRGDLLVHFAGIPDREKTMHYWLQRAEQHLDDWEIPIKSTSYPQEARDFWNEEREKRKRHKELVDETRTKAQSLSAGIYDQMQDFGDRLKDEDKQKIDDARVQLESILGERSDDTDKLKEAMGKLTEAATSLESARAYNNRQLQASAHEAIFEGEKLLHSTGFHQGNTSPDAEALSNNIRIVKALIMAPEASWNRNDITVATNGLTESTAHLQAQVDAVDEAAQKAKANVKALQEAKLAAQLEAVKYAAQVDAVNYAPEAPAVEAAVSDVAQTVPDTATFQDAKPEADKILGSPPGTEPGATVIDASEVDLSNLPDNVVMIAVTATIPGPVVMITAVPHDVPSK